jgi:hypothetical protein
MLPTCDGDLSIEIDDIPKGVTLDRTGWKLRATRSFKLGEVVAISVALSMQRADIGDSVLPRFTVDVNDEITLFPLGHIAAAQRQKKSSIKKSNKFQVNCRWMVWIGSKTDSKMAIAAIAIRFFYFIS